MAGFIKKRKTWYSTLRLPSGKQKSISLKTRNKRVAKSRHKRIENLEYQMKSGQISEDEFLVKTGQKKDTSVVSLKEAIDDFMKQYKLTKAVETLRNYHSTFSNLLNAWDEDKNIKTLTSSDYNTFLNFLINSEVKDSKTGRMKRRWNNTSINIKLRNLRCFLNWCIENDRIESFPFKIEQLPTPQKRRTAFSRNQFDRLLEAAENAPFYRDLFIFVVNTGLRLGEINNSRVKDGYLIVDAEKNKTKRERYLKLSEPLIRIHKNIMKKKRSKNTYTHNLTKYRRKADLPENLKFHCLRYTYAYRHHLQTHDLFETMKALGHTRISTTQIYADVPDKLIMKDVGNWDSNENDDICLELALRK